MVAVLSRNDTSVDEIHAVSGSAQAIPADDRDVSIAVVADDHQDCSRVNRLLDGAAVETFTVPLSHEPPASPEQTFAAVVCHRQGSASLPATTLPRHLRAGRIIVLSDCTSENTVLQFLQSGARHVFDLNDSDTVLQARLEAALRRQRNFLMRSFTVANFHFDVQKRKVIRDGVAIDLSPKEFEFASYIFSRLGKIVVNAELMTAVWSLPAHMDTRRIDTAACRVRKKLGLGGNSEWELRRIRCVGYRLTRVHSNVIELGP